MKIKLDIHVNCLLTDNSHALSFLIKSKEKGNDQESIQSNNTPDPGHHIVK